MVNNNVFIIFNDWVTTLLTVSAIENPGFLHTVIIDNNGILLKNYLTVIFYIISLIYSLKKYRICL